MEEKKKKKKKKKKQNRDTFVKSIKEGGEGIRKWCFFSLFLFRALALCPADGTSDRFSLWFSSRFAFSSATISCLWHGRTFNFNHRPGNYKSCSRSRTLSIKDFRSSRDDRPRSKERKSEREREIERERGRRERENEIRSRRQAFYLSFFLSARPSFSVYIYISRGGIKRCLGNMRGFF